MINIKTSVYVPAAFICKCDNIILLGLCST